MTMIMRIFLSVPQTGLVEEQEVLQLLLDRLKSHEFHNFIFHRSRPYHGLILAADTG